MKNFRKTNLFIKSNLPKQKERQYEEEKDAKKKVECSLQELNSKYEIEKQSLTDAMNQKKDLNENLINLEKQVNSV